MSPRPVRPRPVWLCSALAAAAVWVGTPTRPAPARAVGPATQPADPSSRDAKTAALVEQTEKYYAELYAKPFRLERDARLAQLVAIVSLSRIDGPPLTKKLMQPLGLAKVDPVVAQVAWEALAARATSLSADQRRDWLDAGLAAATDHAAFPGATAAPLVAALSTRPLDAKHRPAVAKLLVRLAEENDPATPAGTDALAAAAKAVAAWADPTLIANLVGEINAAKPGRNARLAALLAALPDAPAEATPAAWRKWQASPAAAGLTAHLPEPAAASRLFPAPERIVDPRDAKWVKETEIGDLRVNKLDLVFCVDGTGSMQASNEFVTAYVRSVSMALGTISTGSTRVGAVYYRHENDPAVMLDCCRKAIKYKDMTVKPVNPTSSPDDLLAAMRAMLPKEGTRISGHGGNGAYYSALQTAAKLLGPAKKGAARIIVCIGDSRMTPGSESKIVELCHSLKQDGFISVFLNRDPWNADNLADASKAASGEPPIVYRDDVKQLKAGGDVYDHFEASAFGQMCVRAIRASVPPEYADRAKPILSAVWQVLVAKERAREARAKL